MKQSPEVIKQMQDISKEINQALSELMDLVAKIEGEQKAVLESKRSNSGDHNEDL